MKKIFNTPEITISAFNLENIVTTSGDVTVTNKTAVQKAQEGLSQTTVSIESIISLSL